MKRGEVWTAAAHGAYTGKPRPVVVIQDDRFGCTSSVTVCPLTTDLTEAPLFRLTVEPSAATGLTTPSCIMVDKVVTVPRDALRQRIGALPAREVTALNASLVVYLGIAG